MQEANGTNTEKGKNGRPELEKKNLQKIFFTSVLTIPREIQTKNEREKSWQDVSVNLSENIPTIAETTTYKSSVFTGNVTPY